MKRIQYKDMRFLHGIFVILFMLNHKWCVAESIDVHVGVVLDLSSPLGSMADLCINMSVMDFYEAHPDYKTRLKLHTRSAKSAFDVNFAVVDLVRNDEVQSIIGPQKETEDAFAAELGGKVQMPIVSFAARSSNVRYLQNQYFVRTTIDDAVQAQALAAICKGFGWPEIVVLYEDTDYGNQFLSHMNKALRDVDVGIAYMVSLATSVTDSHLLKELERLTRKQTRVFLVHMNPSLGFRLFTSAKKAGLMSEGYAWIISDSLSNSMSSMDSVYHDSMEGVLGVRPYVYRSKELQNFQDRFKRNIILANTTSSELNIYGLWAYDTVTALAIAVEKTGLVNSTSFYVNTVQDRSNNTNLRTLTFGPELLNEVSMTRFSGLSGEYKLVQGKLEQSTFEIFNVYGSGEKTIGFWTVDRGIVGEISQTGDRSYSTSTKELKNVIWPGDSLVRPKGWAIPTTGNLRVGIPWKHGFTEFVDVTDDPATNKTNATGFSIDIFLKSLDLLPFLIHYEFYHFNDTKNSNWTYDDMLDEMPKNFDMVVGDTTIWAPRMTHVDFSLPYSESGVILVVKNKKPFDMWIFVKPFSWNLWLAVILGCILMGIVLRILEHEDTTTNNNEDLTRNTKQTRGSIYFSPVAVLAFPERNIVANNWSFFVLIFWLFMAFILMQSYTANLSAILTVDQLKFAFSDNYYVGCQEGSFMKDFLIKQLHINASRLKTYSSVEEYHHAMTLGSRRGGIDAIFDEIPYMKLFMNKYDSEYKMVGPTYRTGGFAFAFPIGSPLVSYFSKAIVDVTQSTEMTALEQANFGPGYSSQDPLSSTISQGASSLTLYDFAGLFLIVGAVTIFSLFFSKTSVGRKICASVTHLLNKWFSCKTSEVNPSISSAGGGSTAGDGEETHESIESGANMPPPRAPGVGEETHESIPTGASAPPTGAPSGGEETHESIPSSASALPPGDGVHGHVTEPVSEHNENHGIHEIVQCDDTHSQNASGDEPDNNRESGTQ